MAARPPARAEFAEARRLAASCAAEVDLEEAEGAASFTVTPEGFSPQQVRAQCETLVTEVDDAAAKAEEAWRARDAELRAVLKGERLQIYEELGEPGGALAGAAPAAVAKAKTWEFVIGPTGKLKTYEAWTITFSGNKVVERKRSRSHEAPP